MRLIIENNVMKEINIKNIKIEDLNLYFNFAKVMKNKDTKMSAIEIQ